MTRTTTIASPRHQTSGSLPLAPRALDLQRGALCSTMPHSAAASGAFPRADGTRRDSRSACARGSGD
ncbi:hypothetical protein AAFF_G00351510 [Aldrovandia affinis]|uniref:Uncharacterized protein n=1 Tax=Aldrovandia affinis TaxID=143900 RepID=A0AAD7WPA8_9TELE|nr:hypothetical protein AAFF_G00351510 [Aldrovandia affinis]